MICPQIPRHVAGVSVLARLEPVLCRHQSSPSPISNPRDAKGNRGPYEESLIANPVADPEKPLEVLRTIHSFDPCLACAIHTTDIEGNEISRVNTL